MTPSPSARNSPARLEQLGARPGRAPAAASRRRGSSRAPRRPRRRARRPRSGTRSRSDRRGPGRHPSVSEANTVPNSRRCASASGPSSRSSSPTAAPTSPRWSRTSRCSRSCRSSFLALVAARPRAPRRRVGLPRQGAEPRVPEQLAEEHPLARPPGAGQRGDPRDRRRRRAPLVVALALQRARVGVQHRLRAAEPSVPQGQGHRGGRDARDRSRRSS